MSDKTGMMAGANPTAPGGMKMADIRLELAEEHNTPMNDTRGIKWPVLIDMLVEARAAAEANDPEPEVAVRLTCTDCDSVWLLTDESLIDDVAAHHMEETEHENFAVADIGAEAEVPPTMDEVREEVAAMDVADMFTIEGEVADMFTEVEALDEEYNANFNEAFAAAAEALVDPTCVCGETLQYHTSEHNFVDAEHYHASEPEMNTIQLGGETIPVTVLSVDEMFAGVSGNADDEPVIKPPLFVGMPTTKDYIFDGHAGAGPSGAERWMNCTASLAASRATIAAMSPRQQEQFAGGNEAARQGTTAHSAAEVECRVLLGQLDPAEAQSRLTDLMIEPDSGEEYTEEMGEWVGVYTDLVKQYIDGGHEVLIEERVSATIPLMTVDADGDPDYHVITGSVDFGALPTSKRSDTTLTVGDLKYGNGIEVDVESNPQIRLYALGLLERLANDEGQIEGIDTIEYVIIQPRFGGIKTWSESVDDLITWRDDVLSPALTEALGGVKAGAKFVPSDLTCQFCPARGNCQALADQRMAAAADLFTVVVETEFEQGSGTMPDPEGLDSDRLGELLAQGQGLVKLVADLKEEAQRRLHRGEPVKGYHLVNYQPPRKWKDGADEELADRPNLWIKKLTTPTQAIKLLGDGIGDIEDRLVEKPDIRPVIGRVEGDKRKAWTGKPPEQMFTVEE